MAGFGADKIGENETDSPYPIADDVLISAIRHNSAVGRKQLFGIHPDFELHTTDPWAQADLVREGVGKEDFIGVFAGAGQFRDDIWVADFLHRLATIHRRPGTPEAVVALGQVKIDGYHPFDERARHGRQREADDIVRTLSSVGFPLTLRLNYEMNLSSFEYGRGRGLPDDQHEKGFKHSFVEYANAAERHGGKVKLSFSPWALPNFSGYWPEPLGVLPSSAGLDGYHLFPGKGQFLHPLYWNPGDLSPEEVFVPSIIQMQELARGRVPLRMWEIGSLAKDERWLAHAALLIFATGFDGVMHFNYNKQHHKKPNEGDWTITPIMAAAYRQVFEMIR